jgi:hypothetical protein
VACRAVASGSPRASDAAADAGAAGPELPATGVGAGLGVALVLLVGAAGAAAATRAVSRRA